MTQFIADTARLLVGALAFTLISVAVQMWREVNRDPFPQMEHLIALALQACAAGDESLEDSSSLPEPHLLAQEIADDLRSALAQIEDVLGDLEQRVDAGASEEA